MRSWIKPKPSTAWRNALAAQSALWERIKADPASAAAAAADQMVGPMLERCSTADAEDWAALDQVQLRMAELLPPWAVDIELQARLMQAERMGLPTLATHRTSVEATVKSDAPEAPAARRMALILLTRDILHRYGAQASERDALRTAANRMAICGAVVIVIMLLLLWWLLKSGAASTSLHAGLASFHLVVLVGFGVLGALFSRLIAFRGHSGAMTWHDISRDYRFTVLLVRLMIGGLAAFLFYYLIAGGMVGGDLFPEVTLLGTETVAGQTASASPGGFGPMWVTVSTRGSQGEQYVLPSANFAKLVIWCFLAGFAERLLPDQLAGLERSAAVKKAA